MQTSTDLAAAVVLVGFALALAAWVGVALHRSPFTTVQSVLYFADVLLTRVLWRVKVEGRLELPADSGAVIVCNHRSSVDPFFVQLPAGRVVHWMVAAEYFRIPLVGSLLRLTGCIPTHRRGIDTAATRQTIRYASGGGLVGMLPEGRINDTSQLLLPGRPGAAMVALKARVPVVPCYIAGSPFDGTVWGCFFMTARVRLVVGKPIDLSQYYDSPMTAELLGEVTLRVLKEIARMAGQPEFEPQLAGRQWRRAVKEPVPA